jgi:two-component system LytT family response regulator
MKALRTFILEDDEVMRTQMRAFVERTPGLELIGSSGDPVEAGSVLAQHPADLVLLDIQLPGLDGYTFLSAMDAQPIVVVVSGDASHAAKAFDHAAVDFLYKPVSYARFQKAMDRVKRTPMAGSVMGPTPSEDPSALDRILQLRCGSKMVEVAIDQIELAQGMGNYVKLYIRGDGHLLVTDTMTHMEELLPKSHFVRIHRSYIIALNAVRLVSSRRLEWRKGELPLGTMYKREALMAFEGKR